MRCGFAAFVLLELPTGSQSVLPYYAHMTDNRTRTALLLVLCTAAVAGCGLEAVGGAATGAAVKKQEIENSQAQKEVIQQQLQQALDQGQQRQRDLEQATK